MDSKELMVKNPVRVAILLELLPRNSPGHLPISNEFLQQFILEDVMLAINLQFGMVSRHVPLVIARRLHLYWLSLSTLPKLTRLSSRAHSEEVRQILCEHYVRELLPMRISLFGFIGPRWSLGRRLSREFSSVD